jgi:hypothetical protein
MFGFAYLQSRKKLQKVVFYVGIWSWLADKLSFHPYEAGFYKPTVIKGHPPFCRITAYATMPG